ncbi:hypothetical protein P1X14_15430 [Sphingomonas sp. AOB5]|uniref:surface-adhesin E family protein n=1 Tax=Sphingomonas sp. AOB5 TaxID=3034017 RepID=UPI0023FA3635|nr:surface-adhesin E family protein [Sphingomonas sp. AOB5]MDF7776648.1 hypothetical protein [Sphingomonas sp. AOB5]
MRMLAAAALIAAMPSATASAQVIQDWMKVGGNDQMIAYVDATSIVRNGDKRTAMTFSGYSKALGDTNVWYTAVKIEYNCRAKTFRTLEYTYYGRDRQSMGTEASFTINENRTPGAGSIDERYYLYVCQGRNGTPSISPFRDTEANFPR